jgi:hypothetical protein
VVTIGCVGCLGGGVKCWKVVVTQDNCGQVQHKGEENT